MWPLIPQCDDLCQRCSTFPADKYLYTATPWEPAFLKRSVWPKGHPLRCSVLLGPVPLLSKVLESVSKATLLDASVVQGRMNGSTKMALLRWKNVVWPQCCLTLVWSQGRQCQPKWGQRGVKVQSSSVCAMFALLVTLRGLLWLGGLTAMSVIPWGADSEEKAPNSPKQPYKQYIKPSVGSWEATSNKPTTELNYVFDICHIEP